MDYGSLDDIYHFLSTLSASYVKDVSGSQNYEVGGGHSSIDLPLAVVMLMKCPGGPTSFRNLLSLTSRIYILTMKPKKRTTRGGGRRARARNLEMFEPIC